MLTRVAVVSDIHGVLPALQAVLAEPDVAAADRIVVTGDMAAGPQPTQALDVLADLGDRVVCVKGNADRELTSLQRSRRESISTTSSGSCKIFVTGLRSDGMTGSGFGASVSSV